MAIFFDTSKIIKKSHETIESVLEFNMEISYGKDILRLSFEPLPNGKHSPYRIKIPNDKGKSSNYETIYLPNYYDTNNFTHHNGEPCKLSLNKNKIKILKNILNNNKDSIYEFLEGKITEETLRNILIENHPEYKIDKKGK